LNPLDYDVAIAGGGLTGASLACALGGSGLRIAVLESFAPEDERQPSFDERTIALTLASKRVFEGLGVWESVADEACAIHAIHISDRGRFGSTRLDRRDVNAPALGYVVPTRSLGHALDRRMKTLSDVRIIRPVTAERLGAEDRSVWVETSDGGRLTASLLALADGGRSALGEQAGLKLQTRGYTQRALVAIVSVSRPHGHLAFERFTRHGPLALLPMTDNRMALAWTLPTEQCGVLCDCTDARFLDALTDAFGDRCGRFLQVGSRKAYPLSLGRLSHPVAGRVVALGNAAHIVHPVAGQGFNLGLRDVAELADLILPAWQRGEDPGNSSLLDSYADARRTQTRRVGAFTDGLISMFANDFAPLAAVRGIGLSVVDLIPPAKRFFLNRTMGQHGRLPRLSRGLPANPGERS
jgi:2-octaprenyl-6-methoxyphenol hydroxylase